MVYETVIGLEVHVELATKTKIFCGCSTEFGGAPNTHCCPVCTGMPGTLPVLNRQVVDYAIAVGLATGCSITRNAKFDRKNYFYPDLPKAYQISELYLPICRNGGIEIETSAGKKIIGIHEIHMEEDAGKLVHDEWSDQTLVDFNRCGVPLLEIVSEPDMRSAEEVIAYLEKLRLILLYLGVSDCRMQEGSMRADVNLSIREMGSDVLGTRTEMKNLNSFKAIARAVEGERARQIDVIEMGKRVVQETRRWDDNKESSFAMRSKEDAQDYRYFPDPDLAPLEIDDAWMERIRKAQPELRDAKMTRYQTEYGLPAYDAELLTSSYRMTRIFERTIAEGAAAKDVSNWLMVEAMRLSREKEIEAERIEIDSVHFAQLIKLVKDGKVNRNAAREIFEVLFVSDCDPLAYAKQKGMLLEDNSDELAAAAKAAVAANPQSVADYKAGKKKAVGFLVGQVMKTMKGKANPAKVNEILIGLLNNM